MSNSVPRACHQTRMARDPEPSTTQQWSLGGCQRDSREPLLRRAQSRATCAGPWSMVIQVLCGLPVTRTRTPARRSPAGQVTVPGRRRAAAPPPVTTRTITPRLIGMACSESNSPSLL